KPVYFCQKLFGRSTRASARSGYTRPHDSDLVPAAPAAVATTEPAAGAGALGARTLLARAGLVHRQRPAGELRAVERCDRLVRPVVHLDEREPAAAPGFAIGDDLRAQHGAVLGERRDQVVAGGLERDVTDVQLLRHKLFHSGPSAR